MNTGFVYTRCLAELIITIPITRIATLIITGVQLAVLATISIPRKETESDCWIAWIPNVIVPTIPITNKTIPAILIINNF